MKELTNDALTVVKDFAVIGVVGFSIGNTLGGAILDGTAHLMTKFPKAAVPIAVGGTIVSVAVPLAVAEGAALLMYPAIQDHFDDLRGSIYRYKVMKDVSHKFSIA